MNRNEFEAKVRTITGSEAELSSASEDKIGWKLSIAQYAVDVLMNEAERRGSKYVGWEDGAPFIHYALPDGVEPVETILTR